jgi:amino acid transporter
MTYYNNNTPCQQQIMQCIISTILVTIIIGLTVLGIEPSISIYILIPSISSLVLLMLINMLGRCYITHQQERLRRRLYAINPLIPPIPPIVILQGNSIMVGTSIHSQPIEHTIVPVYVATIDFKK